MRSLNLLPWRERRRTRRRREACAALLCGLLGALGVVAVTELHFRSKLHEVRQQASQLQAAIADHRGAAGVLGELEARKAAMGSLLAELDRIRKHNGAVRNWLEQLPEALPSESRLTQLAITGRAWELRGVGHSLEEAARLLQALRAMPMVAEARIEHMRSDAEAAREFLLVGGFKP